MRSARSLCARAAHCFRYAICTPVVLSTETTKAKVPPDVPTWPSIVVPFCTRMIEVLVATSNKPEATFADFTLSA